MYTATLISKAYDKAKQRVAITVMITDGADFSMEKQFSFAANSTVQDVKKIVQNFIDELAEGDSLHDALVPGVSIEYTPEPISNEPSAEDVARDAWVEKYRQLKTATKLAELGVTVATPTQITALQTAVKDGFKLEYVTLVD